MNRQILLTGGTGALGPALAAQLARAGAAEHIAVLMRASPAELPERFARWIEVVRLLLSPEDYPTLSRLHPVSGDICQTNLGLNGQSETLQRQTDVVIHAAADTNFSAPQDRLRAVNVEGTQRMLEWSAKCRHLRQFLLVSSAFVSGSRTGRIDETATTEPPDFVTYYQRTKWEAEQVALASGIPVSVARVSMVLGSAATGVSHRTGAVHSLIKWFARGLVPMLPGLPEATGDVIATELAAQCITRAVMTSGADALVGREALEKPTGASASHSAKEELEAPPRPPIWHIAAGQHAPRMTELIDFVYQHFANRPVWRRKHIPRPQLVDQEQFNLYIKSVDASGHPALAHAMRSINGFLPDLLFPKTYATTRAETLWGGPLPQYDWRDTMERVIRFCCPADK